MKYYSISTKDSAIEAETFFIHSTILYKNYTPAIPFNPELKERAKELRKAGNLAEVIFWKQVHRKNFWGIDFDRQKVIGNYIVDFFVKSLSLVIEIDGRSHNQKEVQDRIRQDYLESIGLYVYRIKDADIRNDLNSVIEELERFILHRYATPRPIGHPSARGDFKNSPSG
ncbi:MAG: endonuclease domain-containing protein [Bacteroidota bacterium]